MPPSMHLNLPRASPSTLRFPVLPILVADLSGPAQPLLKPKSVAFDHTSIGLTTLGTLLGISLPGMTTKALMGDIDINAIWDRPDALLMPPDARMYTQRTFVRFADLTLGADNLRRPRGISIQGRNRSSCYLTPTALFQLVSGLGFVQAGSRAAPAEHCTIRT
ncbi:hypothetical protein BV22DRAFT_111449 [Leucogyrophana mollusca]|uniref:Uncharacterized protein n=1 Tax=Leucogyrophana mollusca TaxID=85980 RepID=A0ACB8BWG0_9AGAM|nr:hypothetical protein BV22DRAFT_111449 [Leucogyrophana mollusca]